MHKGKRERKYPSGRKWVSSKTWRNPILQRYETHSWEKYKELKHYFFLYPRLRWQSSSFPFKELCGITCEGQKRCLLWVKLNTIFRESEWVRRIENREWRKSIYLSNERVGGSVICTVCLLRHDWKQDFCVPFSVFCSSVIAVVHYVFTPHVAKRLILFDYITPFTIRNWVC